MLTVNCHQFYEKLVEKLFIKWLRLFWRLLFTGICTFSE